MKKVASVLAIVTILAAAAIANDIRSINTVGYHTHTVSPGGLILVTPTVDNLNGNTLDDLIGEQLPNGTDIFVWNGTTWDPSENKLIGGWVPNLTASRGQGMFIRLEGSEPGDAEFSFTGEVPEYRNGGGTTDVDVAGIDALGYPYPVAIDFTSTAVAQAAATGDDAFFWNGGGYDSAEKKLIGGWDANPNLAIGEAFFLQAEGGPINTEEVQPYDLSSP